MNISRRRYLQMLFSQYLFWSMPNTLFASQQGQRRYPAGFYEKPFTVELCIPKKDGYLGNIDASSEYTMDTLRTESIASMEDTRGAIYTWFTQDKKGHYFLPSMNVKRGGVIRLVFPNTIPEQPIAPYITGLVVENNTVGFLYNTHENRVAYRIQYSVQNPASTCIYHSMWQGNTGMYTHQGLSGILCIHDEIEALIHDKYNIEAGECDIPLILQDRRLNAQGECVYNLTRNDELGGYLGNTLLVNGGVYPYLEVQNRIYRFRLINISNARIFILGFRTENKVLSCYIISTGCGMLPKAIQETKIVLAPFERVDILLDLRSFNKKERIFLANYPFNSMRQTQGYTPTIYTELEQKGAYCMELICKDDYKKKLPSISTHLGGLENSIGEAQSKRVFVFRNSIHDGSVVWSIDTQSDVKGEVLIKGDSIEEWEFINPQDSIPQCIYIPYFAVSIFQRINSPKHIASLSQERSGLIATDYGRTDTVLIWPGERVFLRVHFPKTHGREIAVTMHSKILECFDRGMSLLIRVL